MEDVILLENPRRRRRRKSRARARGRGGRFVKKATRRRRRRNPTVVRARRRRRRAAPVRRRRRAAVRRNPVRRRRRRSSRGGIGGRVLNINRAMSIVKDGAGLAVAEFLGDTLSRLVLTKGPQAKQLVYFFDRYMGANAAMSQKWVQLALAVVGGPTLRRFGGRVIPPAVLKYFELGNAASAIIGLTYGWRQQAQQAMGLSDIGYYDGYGVQDWVTSAPSRRAISPGVSADQVDGLLGLSDWATVDGSASYTGDPFSS